jgi:hypothetical protein
VRYATWIWLVLALGTVLGAAHVFRYGKLDYDRQNGFTVVWDRWLNRMCVAYVLKPEKKLACTFEEMRGLKK